MGVLSDSPAHPGLLRRRSVHLILFGPFHSNSRHREAPVPLCPQPGPPMTSWGHTDLSSFVGSLTAPGGEHGHSPVTTPTPVDFLVPPSFYWGAWNPWKGCSS